MEEERDAANIERDDPEMKMNCDAPTDALPFRPSRAFNSSTI